MRYYQPHCVPGLLEMMWATCLVWHPYHKILPVLPVVATNVAVIFDLCQRFKLTTCGKAISLTSVFLSKVFKLCLALLSCFNIPIVHQLHSDTLVYITIPMDPFKLALDIFLAPNGDKSFVSLTFQLSAI